MNRVQCTAGELVVEVEETAKIAEDPPVVHGRIFVCGEFAGRVHGARIQGAGRRARTQITRLEEVEAAVLYPKGGQEALTLVTECLRHLNGEPTSLEITKAGHG